MNAIIAINNFAYAVGKADITKWIGSVVAIVGVLLVFYDKINKSSKNSKDEAKRMKKISKYIGIGLITAFVLGMIATVYSEMLTEVPPLTDMTVREASIVIKDAKLFFHEGFDMEDNEDEIIRKQTPEPHNYLKIRSHVIMGDCYDNIIRTRLLLFRCPQSMEI